MTDTPSRPIKVAVVGGGLGGLSTTLSILQLQQKFFTPAVTNSSSSPLPATPNKPNKIFSVFCYERDQTFADRRNGYGLTLTYNPSGPLGKLGLLETVAKHDTPSRSHYVFDNTGRILGYYGRAFHDSSASSPPSRVSQRGNMRVPRQVLRKILLDEVEATARQLGRWNKEEPVVSWGKDLLRYEVDPDHKAEGLLKLHFADGSSVGSVDILVGADGVRSSVMKNLLFVPPKSLPALTSPPLDMRSSLDLPSADGEYFGVVIVLGITNFQHPLLHERGFYTLSGHARLFTMPFTGGVISEEEREDDERKTMWQLSFSVPSLDVANALRCEGPKALKDKVLEIVADWHDPVARMVASTSVADIWGTPLLDRLPKPINKKGDKARVVCLGKY